jgi:hypothetical protein
MSLKTVVRIALAAGLVFVLGRAAPAQQIQYVFHISVDGLRPDGVTNLLAAGTGNLPSFFRLRSQGAFTDNARCDYDYSVTLPNHVTQLTGRPVLGTTGHHWTSNSDPPSGATLAGTNGPYIAGAFDVAHDNGLRTGEYASKSKFVLFQTSWNATNGALDVTGTDNGRSKIDNYVNNSNTMSLVGSMIVQMKASPMNYVFLHLTDLDTVGHNSGWDTTLGSTYSNTLRDTVDAELGDIFEMIDGDSRFAGHTAIVLTADHGGYGTDHSDAARYEDYRIPFYVWGPGVTAGADLYGLNGGGIRNDPGTSRVAYSLAGDAIRNGEAGNLALDLLGLGPIPGSMINYSQNLAVPEPATLALLSLGAVAALRRRR